MKERERRQDNLQMADSGNWLLKKKISIVLHSAYTISGIRPQHRKLDFWHETQEFEWTGQHLQTYINFNSQMKAEIFTVEKSLGME